MLRYLSTNGLKGIFEMTSNKKTISEEVLCAITFPYSLLFRASSEWLRDDKVNSVTAGILKLGC